MTLSLYLASILTTLDLVSNKNIDGRQSEREIERKITLLKWGSVQAGDVN